MDWWQYVDTFSNSVCNKTYGLVTDLSCVCLCVYVRSCVLVSVCEGCLSTEGRT